MTKLIAPARWLFVLARGDPRDGALTDAWLEGREVQCTTGVGSGGHDGQDFILEVPTHLAARWHSGRQSLSRARRVLGRDI